ncbi:MAG TPA: hypothetical protein VD866_14315, partial [Urbifossiella sp.]|nr:hypothetical protein [Urbifossiella sp.]
MADVTVGNFRELLEVQVGEGDAFRLVGDRWSLNHVLCDLYALPPDYRFPPATEFLRRAELARSAAPFDWLAVTCGSESEARPLLAEASRRECGPEARSVFLPVLLELLAYTAAPGLLNQVAVERLHAHLEIAWSMMEREHRLLYAGSRLVIKGCAVYPAAGCTDAGMNLLRAIRALVANRVLIDRPDDLSLHATNAALASALCALIWEHLEFDQPLTSGERAAALASNDELAPRGALHELEAVVGAWRDAGERQGWPDRWREMFRRAELDCRYFRLVYDSASSATGGGWPAFPYEEFERLADEYRAVGLPEARVLCGAIGHIAFRLRHRPDDLARFRGAIERIVARLDGAMSQVLPGHPDFLASAARLVECYA